MRIPNVFEAGRRAIATLVNENFTAVETAVNTLEVSKASVTGDSNTHFNVKDPEAPSHAVNKDYIDSLLAELGVDSGIGKALFEVFYNLSNVTPPGAFSLRTGEQIVDCSSTYPGFYMLLVENSKKVFPDLGLGLPAGYMVSQTGIVGSANVQDAFSEYSWLQLEQVPNSVSPITVTCELPDAIQCTHFKMFGNNAYHDPQHLDDEVDPTMSVKTGKIEVRTGTTTWTEVVTFNEGALPTGNAVYLENSRPELNFNAIRFTATSNQGSATSTRISCFPVNTNITKVRVVDLDRYNAEVNATGSCGAFVIDSFADVVTLPKITCSLEAIPNLWDVGSVKPRGSASDSFNESAVQVGLYIQVYSTLSEDAYANIRYLPNGVLLEDRLFGFVPKAETGWVPSTRQWNRSIDYPDAYTLLEEHYNNSKSVTVNNVTYRLAPNGMRFATTEVYDDAYSTTGCAWYWVLDKTSKRFRCPVSNNFFRSTAIAENIGNYGQDQIVNITGEFFPHSQGASGACYIKGGSWWHGNRNNNGQITRAGFDASRVVKTGNQVQPRNTSKILCFFLGGKLMPATYDFVSPSYFVDLVTTSNAFKTLAMHACVPDYLAKASITPAASYQATRYGEVGITATGETAITVSVNNTEIGIINSPTTFTLRVKPGDIVALSSFDTVNSMHFIPLGLA